MTNIRLHLDLAGVDITFQGSASFYARRVEPLVEAACRRGRSAPTVPNPDESASPADVDLARAQPDAVVEAPSTDRAATIAAAAEEAFRPANPARFHRFVGQVGERASTAEQRLMAFGFYLWNYEKRERFTDGEAAAFFATLHLEAPEDLGEVLGSLAQRKRFVERHEDGAGWSLTTKGVNYVKNRLLGSV